MQVDQRTAAAAMIELAARTEVELFHDAKRGPLAAVLLKARQDAIKALKKLVHVPPTDFENIRLLQNEVQRFIDLRGYVLGIFKDSDEAEQQLQQEDRAVLDAIRDEDAGDDE